MIKCIVGCLQKIKKNQQKQNHTNKPLHISPRLGLAFFRKKGITITMKDVVEYMKSGQEEVKGHSFFPYDRVTITGNSLVHVPCYVL